jgi:hypothetical protein
MNITVTMTEAEAHAFIVAKRMMDDMAYSNLLMDEELGGDFYEKTHARLDSLQQKVEDAAWIEQWVAEGKEARPDLSKTVIRKYAKKALKEEKEG